MDDMGVTWQSDMTGFKHTGLLEAFLSRAPREDAKELRPKSHCSLKIVPIW